LLLLPLPPSSPQPLWSPSLLFLTTHVLDVCVLHIFIFIYYILFLHLTLMPKYLLWQAQII
jgi:hypothetical protein